MKYLQKRQPRILGVRRTGKNSGLLDAINAGIDHIAREENWTHSRVIAHIVSDWFDLDSDTGRVLKARTDSTGRWREPIDEAEEVRRAVVTLKQFRAKQSKGTRVAVPVKRRAR